MNEIEAFYSNSKARDDVDLEFEAIKVEIGDNSVIIFDELENDDPYFVILCNKPLHRCQETFEDD
jgi:23S rRNA A1618 N6-methylase RlmF